MYFLAYGILAALISAIACVEPSLCSSWLEIEKKLKSRNLQVTCVPNATCTGMACEFHEFDHDINSSIHVNNCENPPNLEFSLDAPTLKINNWSRKFHQGELFNVTDNYGGEFKMQKVNDTFVFGLTLQIRLDKNPMPSMLHFWPSKKQDTGFEIRYPLFNNFAVHIPSCLDGKKNESHILENISLTVTTVPSAGIPMVLSKTNIFSNCTIANNSCPENELCRQLNTSTSDGICVCVPNYVRDKNGKCIFTPPIIPVTVVPGNHTDSHHSGSSNTSLLLTAILVPITVILVLVGLVYATIRFRICQKMRRRLRVQVYEHVLLGQDDDDEAEDDDDSLNPVV